MIFILYRTTYHRVAGKWPVVSNYRVWEVLVLYRDQKKKMQPTHNNQRSFECSRIIRDSQDLKRKRKSKKKKMEIYFFILSTTPVHTKTILTLRQQKKKSSKSYCIFTQHILLDCGFTMIEGSFCWANEWNFPFVYNKIEIHRCGPYLHGLYKQPHSTRE